MKKDEFIEEASLQVLRLIIDLSGSSNAEFDKLTDEKKKDVFDFTKLYVGLMLKIMEEK